MEFTLSWSRSSKLLLKRPVIFERFHLLKAEEWDERRWEEKRRAIKKAFFPFLSGKHLGT